MFMKEVELKTWKEAETLLPEFAIKVDKFRVQRGKPLSKGFKVVNMYSNKLGTIIVSNL